MKPQLAQSPPKAWPLGLPDACAEALRALFLRWRDEVSRVKLTVPCRLWVVISIDHAVEVNERINTIEMADPWQAFVIGALFVPDADLELHYEVHATFVDADFPLAPPEFLKEDLEIGFVLGPQERDYIRRKLRQLKSPEGTPSLLAKLVDADTSLFDSGECFADPFAARSSVIRRLASRQSRPE